MANHPKLTPEQIVEITRLYEQEGVSQAALAKQFGVSITTIRTKLGLGPGKPKPQPEVVNPLHEATKQAIASLPILLREGGSQHIQEEKKKEPPKRRIVGVNI